MIFERDSNVSRTFLERARRMSLSIGRITTEFEHGPGLATGFLIAPDLVLTCNHVLPDPPTAARSKMLLDYYAEEDGSFAVPTVVRFDPEPVFATNPQLDVTVVALEASAAEVVKSQNRPYVDFVAWPSVLVGEAVSMIHHPLGEPQAFSLRGGQIVGYSDDFLGYDSPTQPGSAGAPLFDDNWRVVAVHSRHVPASDAGAPILEHINDRRSLSPLAIRGPANAGPRADRVWEWLRSLGAPIERLPPADQDEARPVDRTNEVAEPAPNPVTASSPEVVVARDSIFISYAHEDQKRLRFHEELELHLRGLAAVGPLSVWQDGRIKAGTEWLPEIELALRRAKVAVFLVGPHFLVSDFVREKELPPLLQAAKAEGVRIFPFVTHNVAYEQSFLGRFQFYGEPDKPLENLERPGRNKALVDLVRAIALAFDEDPSQARG